MMERRATRLCLTHVQCQVAMALPLPLGHCTALRQAMEGLLAPLLERVEPQPGTPLALPMLPLRRTGTDRG